MQAGLAGIRPEEEGIWSYLQDRVDDLLETFPGVGGLCLKDLRENSMMSFRGDEEFPTASSIKIHILVQLLMLAEAGDIDLAESVTLNHGQLTLGSGVLAYLDGPVTLTRLDVANLMIIASDNTATNLCIDWVGMPETNAMLRGLGLSRTHLRRRMQDQDSIARNEENVSTPVEMVKMIEHLHNGNPSSEVAKRCLDIMRKHKYGILNVALPANLTVANKSGVMENVQCEVGIVNLPRRPYAVAVMTKHCLLEPATHRNRLIEILRVVHETMVVLDTTNRYGQGIGNSHVR